MKMGLKYLLMNWCIVKWLICFLMLTFVIKHKSATGDDQRIFSPAPKPSLFITPVIVAGFFYICRNHETIY